MVHTNIRETPNIIAPLTKPIYSGQTIAEPDHDAAGRRRVGETIPVRPGQTGEHELFIKDFVTINIKNSGRRN